ncbi:hypothetical protein HYH03_017108 [Edaphochlamys debaryana]|uniref:Uncharacterized protein n=1 Tax=Edaphochlamys debaryana TaxID=47281 RepID=A0A836BQT2_9CHLO|nr:hypothetical protein HYH03_017108 [Edaphochlamys debaryana]|eukprot:KAG2484089.1 hypothetical protein HYH03_017108 [Edaphochlamys debaryana]
MALALIATAGALASAFEVQRDIQGPIMPNSQAAGGKGPKSILSQLYNQLSGTYEVFNGTETIWQRPPADTPLKGILFFAHSCGHAAKDLWPRTESCPHCFGLPEEMNITLHSLLRGYAVVAVSSSNKHENSCWHGLWGPRDEMLRRTNERSDWVKARAALHHLIHREGWQQVPLYALGVSSGGGFVLGLPMVMPGVFSGIASVVTPAFPTHFQEYMRHYDVDQIETAWPPTALVHMARDAVLSGVFKLNMAELQELEIPALEVPVYPQPLTPLYLAQRCVPEVDETGSMAIYAALQKGGFINAEGYLNANPRLVTAWRDMIINAGIKAAGGGELRLGPEASPISEELNLLYASNELTSEALTDILDFFEKALAATPVEDRAKGITGEYLEWV